MTKDELRELLNAGEVELKFTKVDGSTRTMLATTSQDIVPVGMNPKDEIRYTKLQETVCCVWDLVNDGWRSFRWTGVLEVNGTQTTISG